MKLCTFSPPIMGIVEWTIELDQPLGRGANATVYKEAINGEEFALKIYHGPSHIELQKLKAMIATPPNIFKKVNGNTYPIFGWPLSLIVEKATGNPIGFVMPLVDERGSKTLDFYYDFILTQKLTSPISKALSFKIEILANLCETIADLHGCGHQFVDLKPQNLRVFENTNIVSLIDCDGYTIKDGTTGNLYRAKMVSPDYIAPEIANIDPKYTPIPKSQDEYALAVIIFQMLNRGIHPFQGILKDPNLSLDTNDKKAEKGFYPYGLSPSDDIAPISSSIHETFLLETRQLFDRAFTSTIRPTARVWAEHFRRILQEKDIVRCDDKPNNIEHMRFRGNRCPVCWKPNSRPKRQKRKQNTTQNDVQNASSSTMKRQKRKQNSGAQSDSKIMWIFFIAALGLGAFFAFRASEVSLQSLFSFRKNLATNSDLTKRVISLEFCNKTLKATSVAIAYNVMLAPRVSAWYNIEKSSCMTIGDFPREQLYWFAKNDDGAEWQGDRGAYAACLNLNSRVDEVARSSCRQGEVLKRFHRLVTGDAPKYTMSLTQVEKDSGSSKNNWFCVSGLSRQGPDNFLVVRYEPNLNSRWRQDIQLSNGDCVQVIGESGDFYRVRTQGFEGWSAKRYLSRAK